MDKQTVLVKMSFGSHVYGTDTPNSDLDFKGVFLSNYKDIILKKDKETVQENTNSSQEKNTKDDVDYTKVELRKFIKDALAGQTYALDMLFTPTNMYIGKPDPTWIELHRNRYKFLSRNIEPFIGYCMKQASKYGIKGSRLASLYNVIAVLEQFNRKDRLSEAVEQISKIEDKFVFFYDQTLVSKEGVERTQKYISILEKKYSDTTFIGEILDSCCKIRDKYGARAEEAMRNEGVDWKAISHAYRCCYELEELATTGEITFPLINHKAYLKKIKAGQISFDIVQEELPKLMERAVGKIETSPLPLEPDRQFWEDFILETYKKVLTF